MIISAAAVTASLLALCSGARADFTLVSQDLSIDRADATANFTMTFNQAPDFTTVNAYGVPADSFQIEFNGNYNPAPSTGLYPADLTAVVRGDEIHVGNKINVRSPNGDGGANSGGWGPVVGSVSYSLIGDKLSFAVPTKDLGWTGHGYSYSAYSLDAGSLTAQQTVTSIPTPSGLWSGLAGLGLAGVAVTAIRRRAAAV